MKDLYQYIAENYYNMSKDDLRTVAMEALYHLSTLMDVSKYQAINEEIIEYAGLDYDDFPANEEGEA